MDGMDRLDTVAIFVAVAEHGNFATAARRLSIPPGAVSRAIAELEGRLRARLLNRTTRSVALTEAGAHYLELARGLLAAAAEFDGAAPQDMEPSGTLRVTAPVNFGQQHLMPLLCRFLDKHPLIDAHVMLNDTVIPMIEQGLDVAIRIGTLRDSSLRATRVGTVRQGSYASPAFLARHGVPSAPAELIRYSTISSGTFNQVWERWRIEGADGPSNVAVKPRLVINSTLAAAETAAAGLGIASLLCYQAAKYVAGGQLIEILPEYSVREIPIHIVQPPGRFTPSKVRAFVEEIGAGLRRKFDRPGDYV